jgi:GNAT superfamily N-acetyltransferase
VERGEYGLSEAAFEAAFVTWWADRQDNHIAFIAESGEEAVGMAWLAVFDRMPQPRSLDRRAGNVQSVFVLEEHRNRGTGRALVEAAVSEARRLGLGYLILHPSRRASPLYLRMGFAATDQILHMALASSNPLE